MNSLKINMFTRNAYFQYSHRAVSVITAFTLVFSTFAFMLPSMAAALDTDFKSPTSLGSPSEWSSPTNAYASDNLYAVGDDDSNDNQQAYDTFAFGVPAGATINGIEVKIEAKAEDPNKCEIEVDISSKSGADTYVLTATSSTDSIYTFGGPSDLWDPSSAWSSSDFSDGTFELEIEIDDAPSQNCASDGTDEVHTDHVQVKVYYTEAEPTSGSYVITGSGTVIGYAVNVGGYASSTPYVGQLNDQHISIDWDDDGNGTFDDYVTEDSDSSGNDAAQTSEITFDIDTYGGSGNSKFFNDNDWTGSHTYATGGAKKIIARVHHATPTGNEGSDFGTIEIDVVIVPPENTLGVCSDTTDNDGDGLIDLADPDCVAFIPTLTVTKIVTNNSGGTAVIADFPLFIDGFGVTSGVASTTSTGLHTVSETNQAGYTGTITGDCAADGTITLVVGQNASCTITNDDNTPSLTLNKIVNNLYRGISVATDWVLSAIGPVTLSGTTPVASDGTFKAGTYALSESGPAGYNASGWVCTGGGSLSGSDLTIGLGETVSCTITNSDKQPGTLHIIKVVQNDNAEEFRGTAGPSDFILSVTGGNPDPSSVVGTDSPGASVTIDGDASYSVSETDGPSGYGVTYSADCDAVMPEGGEKSCTVTNNDNSPTQGYLTVRKHVTNDNGGDADASAWTLNATDSDDNTTPMSDGVATLVDPDTYSISETGGADGYEQTSIMCSTDGDDAVKTSSIVVEAGHSYVCTITNDDIRPTLILEKNVVNDDGGQESAEDWTLTATGDQDSPTVISGAGGAQSAADFQTGTYSLSESDGPAGYTPDETWSCVVNDGDAVPGNSVTLGLDDTAICSITNDDQPGTLIIQKTVINDNGSDLIASDFSFRVNGGSPVPFDANGDDDDNNLTGENTVTVDAGDYEVTEDSVAGYGTTLGADCSGTIANGETKTCTITNNDGQATLHIIKYVGEGDPDGTFDFNVSGGEEFSTSTSITTTEGDGSATISIDAGTYDLQEVSPSGWTLSGASCNDENESSLDGGDTIYGIDFVAGDNITCTFYNDATGADLSLTKTVDDTTPDAGQTITYTLTASNAGPAAATYITVTDVLPAGLTYVSHAGGTYATSTGEWTITELPAASSTSLQIVAAVNTDTQGTSIVNSATISEGDEGVSDYNSENNANSSTVAVNTPAPTPPTPPSGGGNGPVVGSFGFVLGASTGPVGQVLGASTGNVCAIPLLNTYLRRGRNNNAEEVRKLQQFLNGEVGSTLPVTGFFGPLTEQAVNKFQLKYWEDVLNPWTPHGLATNRTPTGYVYKTTQRKINLLYCASLNIPMPQLP